MTFKQKARALKTYPLQYPLIIFGLGFVAGSTYLINSSACDDEPTVSNILLCLGFVLVFSGVAFAHWSGGMRWYWALILGFIIGLIITVGMGMFGLLFVPDGIFHCYTF